MLIYPLTSSFLIDIKNLLNFFPLPSIGSTINNTIICKEEMANSRTPSSYLHTAYLISIFNFIDKSTEILFANEIKIRRYRITLVNPFSGFNLQVGLTIDQNQNERVVTLISSAKRDKKLSKKFEHHGQFQSLTRNYSPLMHLILLKASIIKMKRKEERE